MSGACPVCGEEYLPTSVDGESQFICQNRACRVVTFRAKETLKEVRA